MQCLHFTLQDLKLSSVRKLKAILNLEILWRFYFHSRKKQSVIWKKNKLTLIWHWGLSKRDIQCHRQISVKYLKQNCIERYFFNYLLEVRSSTLWTQGLFRIGVFSLIETQKQESHPENSSGGMSLSLAKQSKLLISHGPLTGWWIGAGKVRATRPSQSNPWNHLYRE